MRNMGIPRIIFLIVLLWGGVGDRLYAQVNRHKIDSLQLVLEKTRDKKSRLKTFVHLVTVYGYSNLDTAKMYSEKGLALALEVADTRSAMFLYDAIGRISLLQGDYGQAVTHFLQGLRIAEAENKGSHIVTFTFNLGAAYDRQHQYDEALEQYEATVLLVKKYFKDDTTQIPFVYRSNIYNNMANVFLSEGDTLKMIKYYEMALAECSHTTEEHSRSIILNNLGKSYVEQGQFRKGKNYILQSLKLNEKLESRVGIVQAYRNLGQYYATIRKYDSALYYYDRGLILAQQANAKREEMEIYEGVANVYRVTQRYDLALLNFQHHKELSDSLFNDSKAIEIERLRNTYEFEKEQAKLILAQRSKEFRLYISLGLSIALCLLAIVMFLLVRSRFKRTRLLNEHLQLQQKSLELEKANLNLELEHKSKELTTTVMYLYKKNELIGNVLDEIKAIRSNLNPANVPVIDRIVKGLGNLTEDNAWQEFETRFNDVHHDFYKALQDQFPELTPNERKLCAFLKLNMTSKEISSITGQSIRGIDVARTRLRKKLNLTNSETNLVDFLARL